MENVICPEPENQEPRRHISDSPLLLAGRAKSRLKSLKISIWCGFECWSMKDSKCASLSKRHLNASKLLTKLVTQYPPVAVIFHVTRSKEERLFGLDSSQVSHESGHPTLRRNRGTCRWGDWIINACIQLYCATKRFLWFNHSFFLIWVADY